MNARLANLILCIAVVLCTAPYSKAGPDTITRFDEFGVLGHCDLGARLDNFAIVLQNYPGSVGHIVTYGPDIDGPGSGKSWLVLMKDYLVETRGLPARRIKTIYAGRNLVLTEPKTQFWITPAGGVAPQPLKYQTDIDTFKGRFSEDEVEDNIEVEVLDDMGPGIGRPVHAAFADMLQQQKKAIAYIVTYNGENSVPGASRRIAARQLESLKQYKVDANRMKTIFGGTRKKSMVELWIMSPNDPPPIADAGAEPPVRKNVLLTWHHDSVLGNPENERAVFTRLQHVLRADPSLKAFVVVRMEGERAEPDLFPEQGVADLPKLVQKWRDELTSAHKIQADRFVVVFITNPPELAGNYLHIWIVPPGQPFPDPDDEPGDEPSDVVQDPERRP